MASDLQGQFLVASNVNFQQRVSAAITAVAVQVYTETPQPANHAARASYAVKVIQNAPLNMVTINQYGTSQPDAIVYAWARLLAAQGLDTSVSDAAIKSQIASDWDAMAGA